MLLWLLHILEAVAFIVGISHMLRLLRLHRLRKCYRNLPADVKNQVLWRIEEYATGRPSLTLLRLDHDANVDRDDNVLQSHVGGVPYAEAGEEWPAGRPATFLLQVRIDEPSLERYGKDDC